MVAVFNNQLVTLLKCLMVSSHKQVSAHSWLEGVQLWKRHSVNITAPSWGLP